MRIVQEKNRLSHWPETVLSAAVITVLLEIVHFVIFASKKFASINDAAFFGLLGNNVSSIYVSALFLVILLVLFLKKFFTATSFILIFSGATANIIDRTIYGGVLDYFKIPGIPFFNLSDICIIVGLLAFILNVFRRIK
jgi:lipoprotein signal peptidase